jgi:hypothetical protein
LTNYLPASQLAAQAQQVPSTAQHQSAAPHGSSEGLRKHLSECSSPIQTMSLRTRTRPTWYCVIADSGHVLTDSHSPNSLQNQYSVVSSFPTRAGLSPTKQLAKAMRCCVSPAGRSHVTCTGLSLTKQLAKSRVVLRWLGRHVIFYPQQNLILLQEKDHSEDSKREPLQRKQFPGSKTWSTNLHKNFTSTMIHTYPPCRRETLLQHIFATMAKMDQKSTWDRRAGALVEWLLDFKAAQLGQGMVAWRKVCHLTCDESRPS